MDWGPNARFLGQPGGRARLDTPALLIDRAALEAAQEANDVMLAHRIFKAGFVTDVSPILAEARRRGGGAIDPIAVYRASKYRAHKAKERPAVAGSSSGIV